MISSLNIFANNEGKNEIRKIEKDFGCDGSTNSVAFHNKSHRGVCRGGYTIDACTTMRKKNERFVRVRNRATIFFSFVRYVSSLSLVPPFGDILLLVPPSQPSHTRCSHVSEKLGPPPFTHTIVRYGSFISLDFPPTSSRCTRLSST